MKSSQDGAEQRKAGEGILAGRRWRAVLPSRVMAPPPNGQVGGGACTFFQPLHPPELVYRSALQSPELSREPPRAPEPHLAPPSPTSLLRPVFSACPSPKPSSVPQGLVAGVGERKGLNCG